jgi:hypothetical protein
MRRAYSGVRRRGLSWQAHLGITRQIVNETNARIAGWTPEPVESCATCDGEAYLLGLLGGLAWYRCRDCGAERSIAPEVSHV